MNNASVPHINVCCVGNLWYDCASSFDFNRESNMWPLLQLEGWRLSHGAFPLSGTLSSLDPISSPAFLSQCICPSIYNCHTRAHLPNSPRCWQKVRFQLPNFISTKLFVTYNSVLMLMCSLWHLLFAFSSLLLSSVHCVIVWMCDGTT